MVDYTEATGYVLDKDGHRQYANRDDPNLVPGTEVDGPDIGQIRNELVYLVAQAGLNPSNKDLTQVFQAVKKLVAEGEAEAAVGYVPVEQGGIEGLTADKVNLGNTANGLSAYVSGKFVGTFVYTSVAAIFPVSIGIDQTGLFPWFADNKGSFYNLVTRDYLTTTLGGKITLSQQFHFDINGYFAAYRQASDASSGILDFYSNYKSANNNVLRVTCDGTIHTLAGGGLSLDDPYANSGNSGDYNASPSISFGMSARGASATLRYEESVGRTNQLTLSMPSFNNNGGSGTYFWFDGPSGRINSSFGKFAFVSDLNAYQLAGDYATNTALNNGLAAKENAGVCVPVTTYVNDFNTSDSRVINLPYGHKIQSFTVDIPSNGSNGHRITYPEAFSGAATPTFNLNDTGQSRSVSLAHNSTPDATGFDIAVSVHGNSTGADTGALKLTVNAIGSR